MKVDKIILYDEPSVPEINLYSLRDFLKENFPIDVEIRGNFFEKLDKTILQKIKDAQITDLKKPFEKQDHKSVKEKLSTEQILYDGFEIQKIISNSISENDDKTKNLHIIFTQQLVGTFSDEDFRYHARALISSNPSIISTSGIVEAPAKPKKYYLDLMTNFSGESVDSIKMKYKEQFVEYNDPRLGMIVEGYVLQSLIYYETGESFCDQNYCRLFNAHWQEELLSTQVRERKFCDKHKKIITKIANKKSN